MTKPASYPRTFANTRELMQNSTAVTPEPREHIVKLLLKVEQTLHKGGWDQPPFVGFLDWVTPHALALGLATDDVPPPPAQYMLYLGQQFLEDPQLGKAFLELARGRYYGSVFVCEGWQVTSDDPEAMKLRAEGRSYADIPGGKEVRMLSAVDIWGRPYHIQRVRGQKPEAWETSVEITGRVFDGLTRMTLGIVDQMPDNHLHVEALIKLGTDLAETARKAHDVP